MTDPVGCVSKAEQNLRITLADSAAFRAWVDAGPDNQAEALARIYTDALPPPADNAEVYTLTELQTYRPFAIVTTDMEGGGFNKNQDAISDTFELQDSGQLELYFEQDVPAEIADDPAEIGRQVKNTIGQIMDELAELAGGAGYLAIRTLRLAGPGRSEPDVFTTLGDFVGWSLQVEW